MDHIAGRHRALSKPGFEWDARKDAENRAKHGIAFAVAQHAFADPQRVIAEDTAHSAGERRYFCFGRVGEGILTVRFTCRQGGDSNLRRRLLAQGKDDL